MAKEKKPREQRIVVAVPIGDEVEIPVRVWVASNESVKDYEARARKALIAYIKEVVQPSGRKL